MVYVCECGEEYVSRISTAQEQDTDIPLRRHILRQADSRRVSDGVEKVDEIYNSRIGHRDAS